LDPDTSWPKDRRLSIGNNLLIIEDDPEFADYLRRGLIYEGYQVQMSASAEDGLGILRSHQPSLIILDVMLPGMDGISACRHLRQTDYLGPILMLTARDAVGDRVNGLDAGADDYLGKPFDFDELLARLRALMRRQVADGSVIVFADLELDEGVYTLRRHGATNPLTRTEFALLAFLLANPRKVLTRDVIIGHVWGTESSGHEKSLDVYISRLRRKLGKPPLIHTLHGVGYILKEKAP
jgi:two-component system response regulator MprA